MNRVAVWLVLLIVVVLSSCSSKARNPDPPASAPVASPAEPKKSLPKIVAFGDSLTAGYGLPETLSYPTLLQKKLVAAGLNYDVVNAGVSGDTTAGGVRRADWALEGDVRLVVLELGANDILRGQPVDQMKKNLSAIIERAKAKGTQVLLAGMEAPPDTGLEYRRAVHDAFPALAKEHGVRLITFFLAGVAGVDSLNQADGIHPNARGTEIVAETVYQAVLPLLGKNGS